MIQRALFLFLLFFAAAVSVQAAQRELTVYSDGSLVELEVMSKKGVAEVMLPAQIREGTLRVKPLDNGTLGRVELLPFRMPDKLQKELNSLFEQKSRLEDRMKALDSREGIFAAAAKSQSSKAPRKSKANPDPLTSVRQGTDFAIAQLESVYTARRRTEQELKRVEARRTHLLKNAVGGPTVRVTTIPATTRLRVAAVLTDNGWKPRYEIHLQGNGTARLSMLAEVSNRPDGYTARVVPATLSTGQPPSTYPLATGTVSRLAEWNLPVEKEQITNAALPFFAVQIRNNSNIMLPAGQAAIYSAGEYIGAVLLPPTHIGTSMTLSNTQ